MRREEPILRWLIIFYAAFFTGCSNIENPIVGQWKIINDVKNKADEVVIKRGQALSFSDEAITSGKKPIPVKYKINGHQVSIKQSNGHLWLFISKDENTGTLHIEKLTPINLKKIKKINLYWVLAKLFGVGIILIAILNLLVEKAAIEQAATMKVKQKKFKTAVEKRVKQIEITTQFHKETTQIKNKVRGINDLIKQEKKEKISKYQRPIKYS